MKKILSCILLFLILTGVLSTGAYALNDYPVKRENLLIRDPYILVYENKYYMYGTCLSRGQGYGCVVSEDLENWSEPIQIFSPFEGFDGCADYWAPECHYYNGSFYLFASYRSSITQKRGTAIFKSTSPVGPFELITDGHITPKERDCIDGTLYIDDDGQPWMVYVNEWTSSPDEVGEMAAAKLSDDFTEFISEPIMLFRARNHIWTTGSITDGPVLYKTENGKLVMLWSNLDKNSGYAVGMAVSDNGRIDGNWIHSPKPFYNRGREFSLDGGHPMLFKTLDGEFVMSIHSPNSSSDGVFETAKFIPVEDTGNMLRIKNNNSFKSDAETLLLDIYFGVLTFFTRIFK